MKEKWVQRIGEGKWYKVIDETEDSVCVESVFEYVGKPHFRKVALWWDKYLCRIVEVDVEKYKDVK